VYLIVNTDTTFINYNHHMVSMALYICDFVGVVFGTHAVRLTSKTSEVTHYTATATEATEHYSLYRTAFLKLSVLEVLFSDHVRFIKYTPDSETHRASQSLSASVC